MESNVNLFQSAYFGKAYKTRDGRKAIYIQENCCIVEGNLDVFSYFDDGHFSIPLEGGDIDIVSEWTEPINEEELHKQSEEYAEQMMVTHCAAHHIDTPNHIIKDALRIAYKAGYRQGWKDKQ